MTAKKRKRIAPHLAASPWMVPNKAPAGWIRDEVRSTGSVEGSQHQLPQSAATGAWREATAEERSRTTAYILQNQCPN